MQKYERTIGLRTIYLTLIRRTEMILAIFLVLAGASFIVTNFFMAKQYTSTSVVANNAAISEPAYTLMQNNIKSDNTMNAVVKNLSIAGVKHKNGNAIMLSDVKSGLSFSTWASNMVQFTLSYKTNDETVAQPILTEVTSVAYDVLKPSYAGLTIYSEATKPAKTSKENTYLLVGVAASLVLALGVPFIVEIVDDSVYVKEDLEDFGALAFEVRASGK